MVAVGEVPLKVVPDLYGIGPDGKLTFRFHPGQLRAWDSKARITAIIAGTQSGKTVMGPLWLWREIVNRGPGDYLVASPTFALMERNVLPQFKRLFEEILGVGRYHGQPIRQFVVSARGEVALFGARQTVRTVVYFGYAENPDSLESITAKAAWLDEAGQKAFKLASYEAIERRMAIHLGRLLITTTPYDLGWLKTRIWNRRHDPLASINVVRFDSTENPAFPVAALEEARRTMPRWRFNLFYRGIFTRPAGAIYDNFRDELHTIPRRPLPERWPRYVGMDFGGVNTAAVFFAEEPGTKRLYAYREYLAGHKTARDHAADLMMGEPRVPLTYGGAGSEDQWRIEFNNAGFPIKRPIVADVEVGIDRVYGAITRSEILVFDDLTGLLDEINSYSREVDLSGNTTAKIADKETFHRLDAVRYIIGSIRGQSHVTSTIFEPKTAAAFDPDEDLGWATTFRPYRG